MFTKVRVAIGLVTLLVIAGLTAWALRLDHLRAGWENTVYVMLAPLEKAHGLKPGALKREQGYDAVTKLVTSRDAWKEAAGQFKAERDNAVITIDIQNDSIRAYEAETNRLKTISAASRAKAEKLVSDRNVWIAQAKEAASRADRLEAEAELAQTEAALNALYEAGF